LDTTMLFEKRKEAILPLTFNIQNNPEKLSQEF
jgi:hypothetical protein